MKRQCLGRVPNSYTYVLQSDLIIYWWLVKNKKDNHCGKWSLEVKNVLLYQWTTRNGHWDGEILPRCTPEYRTQHLLSFRVQGALFLTLWWHQPSSMEWSAGVSTADRKRLNSLVKEASSVLGFLLDPVDVVVEERRLMAKLYYPRWRACPTPCRTLWQHLAAPSVTGCFTRCVWRRNTDDTAVRLYNKLCDTNMSYVQ